MGVARRRPALRMFRQISTGFRDVRFPNVRGRHARSVDRHPMWGHSIRRGASVRDTADSFIDIPHDAHQYRLSADEQYTARRYQNEGNAEYEHPV